MRLGKAGRLGITAADGIDNPGMHELGLQKGYDFHVDTAPIENVPVSTIYSPSPGFGTTDSKQVREILYSTRL